MIECDDAEETMIDCDEDEDEDEVGVVAVPKDVDAGDIGLYVAVISWLMDPVEVVLPEIRRRVNVLFPEEVYNPIVFQDPHVCVGSPGHAFEQNDIGWRTAVEVRPAPQ